VRIIFSLFRPYSMSSYLDSIAIHMKYVSLGKLNKNQIMVELRSALGQYLKQVICYV
jgi:hypothetical protein